ncbi:MAG: hypothetical protein LAP40_09735 [Acidobacteriia bacterium]|nr:hypothetical protein [Terriglobia bacterium]
MDWLEQELKRALERKEPAPEFTARVLAAARRRPSLAARRWIAIAASVVVLAGGGVGYRWYAGIQAKNQVMLAVRIAAGKLNQVQTHVLEVTQ